MQGQGKAEQGLNMDLLRKRKQVGLYAKKRGAIYVIEVIFCRGMADQGKKGDRGGVVAMQQKRRKRAGGGDSFFLRRMRKETRWLARHKTRRVRS